MGAVRKWMTIWIFSLTVQMVNAQTAEKSFSFDNAQLPKVVQEIVEAFGLYVSFDPAIFRSSSPVSFNIRTSSMAEALDRALGDRFGHRVINEYVVITPKKDVPPPPTSMPVRQEQPVVYDTIIIEQTEVYYDTVQVESLKTIRVYDTTTVEKEIIIYDTVKYLAQRPEDKNQFFAYVAPTLWRRDSKSLHGISTGFSYRHQWKDFYLEGGLNYNYSMQNVSFSQTETFTELQVDTVSTFYIIEHEERIPIYVVDSTFTDREQVRETNRTNTVHWLSLSLLAGRAFSVTERIDLGVNLGLTLDWIFQTDEVMDLGTTENDQSVNTPSYRFPLQNFRLELPVMYRSNLLREGYYLTPYGEWGLNSDFENKSILSGRYRFGIKLGIFF